MAFQKVLTSFIIISSGNWACLFICLTATTVSATATLCSSGYTCNNPKTLGDFVTADLAAAAGEHYLIDLLLTYSCACAAIDADSDCRPYSQWAPTQASSGARCCNCLWIEAYALTVDGAGTWNVYGTTSTCTPIYAEPVAPVECQVGICSQYEILGTYPNVETCAKVAAETSYCTAGASVVWQETYSTNSWGWACRCCHCDSTLSSTTNGGNGPQWKIYGFSSSACPALSSCPTNAPSNAPSNAPTYNSCRSCQHGVLFLSDSKSAVLNPNP